MSLQDQQIFIYNNLNQLSLQERKNVLQIIISSGTEENKIITKNNGVLVKGNDLSENCIKQIYTYIENCIINKTNEINNLIKKN